jgi:penicillin amidase
MERRVTGLTLPGIPVLVLGSNGSVAWGFTNSQGDWLDVVLLELDPDDPSRYRTPDGPRAFETHSETIRVRDGADEMLVVRETIWGPVPDEEHLGQPFALRWIAHDREMAYLNLDRLETATDLEAALAAAAEIGAPPQNFLCADTAGRIGWTILGRIPRRFGHDGRLPASWADGMRGWDGWLEPGEYPRIVDPEDGLLWTANARVVDGEALRLVGDGWYAGGARAPRKASASRFGDVAFLLCNRQSSSSPGMLDIAAARSAAWRTSLAGSASALSRADRSFIARCRPSAP